MATEEHEVSNGWPLGLEAMSMRLRVPENTQSAPGPAPQPYSFQGRSSSFSSFASSNLDTESTASFFQDNSVSLGRLIGFRQRDGGRGTFYIQNSIPIEEHKKKSAKGACKDGSWDNRQSVDTSRGHCVSLLLGTLVRINRNKRKSKQLDA